MVFEDLRSSEGVSSKKSKWWMDFDKMPEYSSLNTTILFMDDVSEGLSTH